MSGGVGATSSAGAGADEAGLWADWAAYGAGFGAAGEALRAEPASLPEPGRIPPREWLYGRRLLRRFVSVMVSQGGVGKSALALGMAASLASGRELLGERVHHAVPAWVMNLEDPLEEMERRLAALMIRHGVEAAALRGRLFLHSGRQRRLCMARVAPGGFTVEYPDRVAVVAAARERGIGLIVVDPFVKSHALEENSNAHMDAAATAWAEVAEACGAAVLLVHHVRKGGAGERRGDADQARGGKALTDAARAVFVLSAMSAEEAEELDVPAAERWRHIRLDDAKANLAPLAEAARWFRLEGVELGNGSDLYPAGDHVAAVVPWEPRTVWARLSVADCNAALDLIAAGPAEGGLYAPHRRRGVEQRWAGRVLLDAFGLTEAQAAQVIGAWLKSGLLREEAYADAVQRKRRLGVVVTDAQRPAAPVFFR